MYKSATIENIEESKNTNITEKKANLLKKEVCFFLFPLFEGMGKNTHSVFNVF